MQREQEKMPISQSFLARDLTLYVTSCCLSIWLLISMHLGAHCDPPKSTKDLMDISPPYSSGSLQQWNQVSSTSLEKECRKYLPRRRISTHLVPKPLCLPSKEWAPKSPHSDSEQGLHSWIPQVYSKQRNNFSTGIGVTPTAIHLASTRNEKKSPILQFLPGRGLTAWFSSICLRV